MVLDSDNSRLFQHKLQLKILQVLLKLLEQQVHRINVASGTASGDYEKEQILIRLIEASMVTPI